MRLIKIRDVASATPDLVWETQGSPAHLPKPDTVVDLQARVTAPGANSFNSAEITFLFSWVTEEGGRQAGSGAADLRLYHVLQPGSVDGVVEEGEVFPGAPLSTFDVPGSVTVPGVGVGPLTIRVDAMTRPATAPASTLLRICALVPQ